ncbi:hypothetical protein QR79_06535, partial [Methylobacterium indicum]
MLLGVLNLGRRDCATKKFTLKPDAFTGDGSGASAAPPGADLPRKIGEWFGDRANVMAFAGSDLSVRFAKACASLPSTGGTIYLPKGMPQSNGALVCNGKPVSLKGDGPGVSQVVFTSAAAGAAGISLSPGDALRPVTIDGLTLTTSVDQTAGNAAITLRYGAAPSNIFKGPRITNVEIAGVGNNSTYWGKGIDAYNIWGFDFHGIHIRGKDFGGVTSFPGANMGAAVSITGENGGGCSDGKISGVNVFFARYVGYVSGDCEGLHWTDNTGVAVDQGISWPDAKGYPGFFISNNHFNTFSTAIAISGAQQGFITSNLLYKWAGSSQDWRGIYLGTYVNGATTYYANDNIIRGNTMYGSARG